MPDEVDAAVERLQTSIWFSTVPLEVFQDAYVVLAALRDVREERDALKAEIRLLKDEIVQKAIGASKVEAYSPDAQINRGRK